MNAVVVVNSFSNVWKKRYKPWMVWKEDQHIAGAACRFFPSTAGWQIFHGVKGHTFFCVSGYSLHRDQISLTFVFTHTPLKFFPLTVAELRISWLAKITQPDFLLCCPPLLAITRSWQSCPNVHKQRPICGQSRNTVKWIGQGSLNKKASTAFLGRYRYFCTLSSLRVLQRWKGELLAALFSLERSNSSSFESPRLSPAPG